MRRIILRTRQFPGDELRLTVAARELQLANAAAGLAIEQFGVEPITRSEIARELPTTERLY